MATVAYPKFKEALLGASLPSSLATATIKVILADLTLYTYGAAHQFLSDVPSGARILMSSALTGVTITSGVLATSASASFTGTGTGASGGALIVFVDTGTASTSPLICYEDTGVTGLPIVPPGGSFPLVFGPSGNGQILILS